MTDDTPARPHARGRTAVDEHTRARVRKLAREGMSRNVIARETGLASSTVSRICKAAGIPFDRAQTMAATEARVIDLRAERARLAERAVLKAHELLDRMDAEHEVIHWDKDGVLHRATISHPTSGDVKNYWISLGIATDKHLALIRHDSDDKDLPAVDQWLAWVTAGATSA
ncbi:helix-turn-helix domain-containing protein [Microbacterium sp. P01]|uniref:helix-turn-helix domain-containing protein n=1 Tax=Microbacterium sp. P01 TaxID=3366261 RepID=UPI00366CFBB1